MADSIVGTWRFESSTNDEALAQILSYPIDVWNKMKEAKPEETYSKVSDTTYHVKHVDVMFTQEHDITLNEETVTKYPKPDGTQGEAKMTVTRDGNTWKETGDYGVAIIETVRTIDGDTMTVKFSCKDVSGSAVYKRV